MKSFKIRVTPEQSGIVQETLFDLGYKWHGYDPEDGPQYIEKPELYVMNKSFKSFGWGDDPEYFKDCKLQEITFEQFQLEYNGIFPQKWRVRDCDEVTQWANSLWDCPPYSDTKCFFCIDQSKFPNSNCYRIIYPNECNSLILDEYTEITLEQFKQYILNNTMKEVKITVPDGYEIDKENSTFECIKFKEKAPAKPRGLTCHVNLSDGEIKLNSKWALTLLPIAGNVSDGAYGDGYEKTKYPPAVFLANCYGMWYDKNGNEISGYLYYKPNKQ